MTDSQTIPDAHGIARDQLRAFIERIERLEEEKKTIADDIKDVYGEAKGVGFDTKVLRKLISIRKQDRDERAEQEAILDMYMIALGMVDEPAGYDEPRQSEPVERQAAMALRSDAGLNIVTKHTEITASPGTAEETPKQVHGDSVEDATAPPSQSVDIPAGGENDQDADGPNDTCLAASHSEKATVATQGEATAPTSDERVSLPVDDRSDAAANAGGDHVDGNALRVPTSVTGEGAASALPAKPKVSFRPNCLQPEMCRSGTRDHCYSCRKAMAQHEDAA